MKKLSAIIILVVLLIVPAKWAYFELDPQNPAKALFAFLAIVVGVMVSFFLFNSNDSQEHTH